MIYVLAALLGVPAILFFLLLIRFKNGKRRAQEEWQNTVVEKITDCGSTKSLEILPLVDWFTSNENLKGEQGVSYLIKTDSSAILYDLGFNFKNTDPSPLLHNMKTLGIGIDDFDTIVISHNHPDHIGGMKWGRQKTFSLTTHQVKLGDKKVYTPIPMTYPGLDPKWAARPTVIADGVVVTGTIPNQLFFFGWTQELSLAINVEGKGIVIIIGCGHPTLPKIIDRVKALFDEPIYGVIGGLHYPVSGGRGRFPNQKIVGTGKLPWTPITSEEVSENIKYLEKENPGIVALSPHDSCDASIDMFRKTFPDVYVDIKVGEKITI